MYYFAVLDAQFTELFLVLAPVGEVAKRYVCDALSTDKRASMTAECVGNTKSLEIL